MYLTPPIKTGLNLTFPRGLITGFHLFSTPRTSTFLIKRCPTMGPEPGYPDILDILDIYRPRRVIPVLGVLFPGCSGPMGITLGLEQE